MRRIGLMALVALPLLLSQPVVAGEQAKLARQALEKAAVLEKKLASRGQRQSPAEKELITKVQAQAVDPTGTAAMDNPLVCMARVIYWEARGKSDASQEAVASVVMNRLRSRNFPHTVCGVVKQGGRKTCQFPWTCDKRSDNATGRAYTKAKEIARRALNQQISDKTQGALFFNHKNATGMAKRRVRTVVIGNHAFYK